MAYHIVKNTKSKIAKLSFILTVIAVTLPLTSGASVYNATLNGNAPVPTESKDVVLKSINELVSPDKVRVNYVLDNTSEQKSNIVMAYKMPNLRSDYMHSNLYKDFEVTVAGEKVSTNESRKAFLNGKDITDALKKNGLEVPVDACLRGADKKFTEVAKKLDAKQKKDLNTAGIDIDNILKGDCWLPWELEINYSWTITLDPKKDTQVDLSYTPNLTSFSIPVLSDKIKQEYCIDEKTYTALAQKIGLGKTYPYFFEESFTPAKNWKGPIEKVKLSIESKKVGSYVFSCFGGIDRKSEFELSSEQFNLDPQEELKVLYLLKN